MQAVENTQIILVQKKKTMTNEVKVIRDKSRPAISWSNKSRFLEQNPNKKTDQNNVNPIFFIN